MPQTDATYLSVGYAEVTVYCRDVKLALCHKILEIGKK